MGYRQFVADLRAAKEASIDDSVTDLRASESEGGISFRYAHHKLVSPLDIQALDQNIDEYPQNSAFILFTVSDSAGDGIVSFLSSLTPRLTGKSVSEVIAYIVHALAVFIDNPEDSREDFQDVETEDELSQSDLWDEEEDDDFKDEDDEAFGLSSASPSTQRELHIAPHWQDKTEKQRHDLGLAIRAGISVAVLGAQPGQLGEIIALSISVSQLGLSDDILSVWGLQSCDHVMLLLDFPNGYPSLSEFLALQSHQAVYQARLGKCASVKPSFSSARSALMQNHHRRQECTAETLQPSTTDQHQPSANRQAEGDNFTPMHLFNSITTLLNQEFPVLLRTRREHGISSDAAQELVLRRAQGAHVRDANYLGSDAQYIADAIEKNEKQQPTSSFPQVLAQDHALEDEADFSIPLSMMLFALRRLIQSGKYCANCHQRVTDGFEGMKPYVCSRPLCLDQYFSSGMGPGIEHDIINSPAVVDLLISFFYTAVSTRKIREVPKGLGILTLYPGDLGDYQGYLEAKAYYATKRVQLNTARLSLKAGHRVFLMNAAPGLGPFTSILSCPVSRFLCRITSLDPEGFDFEICASWENSSSVPTILADRKAHVSSNTPSNDDENTTNTCTNVRIFLYLHSIDDFEPRSCHSSLTIMACGIPAVPEMRQFLLTKPGRRLSSWEKLDHQTYKLLHWIISSNQSLIVQDNPGPGQSADEEPPSSTKLIGMPNQWMQFRFLQGSPEKELKFQQEMMSSFGEQLRNGVQPFPTIFAWHGSQLGNWHSIIRTSLDHTRSDNGRSYGDGVYFSNQLETSARYSGFDTIVSSSAADSFEPDLFFTWPHSILQVGAAVGCCEIINRPDQFVATDPFYVVNNIDWIQCRYLFVRVNERSLGSSGIPFLQQGSQRILGTLNRDPDRQLMGPAATPIAMPCSAVPTERLMVFDYLASGLGVDGENEIWTNEEWAERPVAVRSQDFEGVDADGILS